MVTIEQVRQLESRVAKAIDYLNKVTDENTLLKNKLDSYQKRIDELEVLIQRFREDQGRIEEGILSALERLNQFEDDVQKTITAPIDDVSPASEASSNVDANNGTEADPVTATAVDAAAEAEDTSELDIF
ncbi:MAG: cell division protein ZapB [Spirochaetaceae bacterium]|jgi:chromosome segregation ATPase|nr:cell division protein ZapB [Spirochaetaceae bacterium]